MPTRTHRARHEPPSLFDHWLAHPWQIHTVGGTWTALGAMLAWTWIDPGAGPATILTRMPAWVAGGVAIALLLSGAGILLAAAWTGRDSTSWRIELAAIPLGVAAWASYAVVATSTPWVIISIGFIAGALVRWAAVWANARNPQLTVILTED